MNIKVAAFTVSEKSLFPDGISLFCMNSGDGMLYLTDNFSLVEYLKTGLRKSRRS